MWGVGGRGVERGGRLDTRGMSSEDACMRTLVPLTFQVRKAARSEGISCMRSVSSRVLLLVVDLRW